MKYRCEVGSFCTRLQVRHITVSANSPDEAEQKAIYKYWELEQAITGSVDAGSPQVDDIEEDSK